MREQILNRITNAQKPYVWTPSDFLDLGSRDAVDKTLQRLVQANILRRVDRGLYDFPKLNKLTGTLSLPDYQAVIDAISRRDKTRILIDGLTAANDLGLTNAVPGKVTVLTDSRLKSITIGKLVVDFKHTAPSKLYWAGRPAMRVVQALHWLRDVIDKNNPESISSIKRKIVLYLKAHPAKKSIVNDLREGVSTLPIWMHEFVKDLLVEL